VELKCNNLRQRCLSRTSCHEAQEKSEQKNSLLNTDDSFPSSNAKKQGESEEEKAQLPPVIIYANLSRHNTREKETRIRR
jgi:hypothetical protein